MKRKEMIAMLAEEHEVSQAKMDRILRSFVGTIQSTTLEEGRFSVSGLGTFKLVTRAGRLGRNPQTGEELSIPETTVVKFKPAPAFKEEAANLELG